VQDVHEAIAAYEQAIADGKITFNGEFAEDYPGRAAQDQALKTFLGSHIPADM
jgi:hypothetical protein